MKQITIGAIFLAFSCVAFGQTTQQEQSKLTPDAVVAELMEGNARFVAGEVSEQNIPAQRANAGEWRQSDLSYPSEISSALYASQKDSAGHSTCARLIQRWIAK